MNFSWIQSVFPIATIFSFRLLGLFMLIPVFTLYAPQLNHATPVLIGLALGSYGLSQGLLQIPFGLLSDRYGRKPMITIGLSLFAAGSLLGTIASSIELMIAARTLQGAGAIGSVLIALLADLTPDNQRTKAMAVIGISIGLSFSLAMVISPLLTQWFGLAGVFYLTALLAFCAIGLLHLVIPTPQKDPFHQTTLMTSQQFLSALKNRHLQRLNGGIFIQHLILTSTFFVIPMLLKQQIHQKQLTASWQFYLPLMILAFVLMLPVIAIGEKKQRMKSVFITAVAFTAIGQGLLAAFSSSWIGLCIAMLIYFIAFNILEASLPSLVSRQAGIENKGTAMGIYSSCQFLGIFAGGSLAGLVVHYTSTIGIFYFNTFLSLLWLLFSLFIKPYAYELTLTLSLEHPLDDPHALKLKLGQLPGVISVSIAARQIHLRVAKDQYVSRSAETLIGSAL